MADGGVGEGAAAAWDAWEAYAAAAAAAAAEGVGTAGAAGAAAGGLSAADLAAMSSVGGGSELGGLGATDSGLLASMPYGAGNTVTDSLVSQPGQGPGLYDELKYKAANALNKAGGQYNKLPGPAQALLMKGLLGSGESPHPVSAMQPRPGSGATPPVQPTYQSQPYQPKSFGSSYGTDQSQPFMPGDNNISPEMLAYIKKMLQMQRGGSNV